MQKLLIFPFNGNAVEAIDCLKNSYELIGFIDDDSKKHGEQIYGYKVFGREIIKKIPDVKILAVPGSPLNYYQRERIINTLNIETNRFATVIHPKAVVSSCAKIGYNVLIMAGVVITSNAIIHNHICILPNSVIHHDTIIEDYCLIGSNVSIAGNTIIHKKCYIGTGTNIINGIEIGENTLVGLGTNVIKSLPADITAVGNPAKLIGKAKNV
jgi:sugar O-acyltransferase (sialic acid O-acetyltransferase NeuD family)